MFESVNSLHFSLFSGKTVVVTGAAHGIGAAICCAFTSQGANVIGTDILAEELEQVRNDINDRFKDSENQNQFDIFPCDITEERQVIDLIQYIIEKYKKIDILVNNAGGVCGQVNQPIEDVQEDEWRKIFNVNLDGAFFTTKAVAPYMKKQKYGRIINISSGAGRSTSLTGIQAYASAKAGQIGFTRQMAQELGPFGITVNNIAPGFVLSNPSTRKQWERMTKSQQEGLIESISVKRLGEPVDIANPVLFFASDFASYISGQTISVDGGQQLF
ncbi:SDR family NAD(P)-dependent oxidoreductase [Neobacillus novalis]|uniref:SDR family NAD(P)-dependent oxidoreductase n=1 Tax=Neobacillus novalis TaxID=220687 RepID=A0AA95MYI9_9BACI|nr:SDR family NAD(P)-dependent oxidoreductase [Neobacillus novalis]WHY88503.1 SDR family NAD(P)-dependent oxidoreductase [Neobacillus novalis]